jgi:Rod binding domain-containing protein
MTGHAVHSAKQQALAAANHHAALVRQTQKWVANAFYGTLLKQMRESPFNSQILDGGRGGKMFTEMFDQQLADRMSRGAPSKLVNAIVQKIEGGKASRQYLKHRRVGASAAERARLYVAPH